MNIILFGPPGAGKGTQGELLVNKLGMTRIIVGDVLRHAAAAQTAIGKQVQQSLEKGELAPDALIVTLIRDNLVKMGSRGNYGVIFDGFPRTVAQALALAGENVKIDAILALAIPDTEVIKRLTGRRIHVASGRVYHTIFSPPCIPDKDDITGEPLIQRPDDSESTVKKRLAIYHAETKPVLDWYRNHGYNPLVIDACGSKKEVLERIIKALEDKFNKMYFP